ncbi:hypothetical protein C0Q70_21554 [Pomacea canaliculata]|uniref:Uncharacterized protein n=1 Tax=Pomacea canaliculata TaxID=400727 RepID=A0A2T7NCW2_POMCA|nr:hypothetical protein C0Q70_21554 [Pomacea canaliculata]
MVSATSQRTSDADEGQGEGQRQRVVNNGLMGRSRRSVDESECSDKKLMAARTGDHQEASSRHGRQKCTQGSSYPQEDLTRL